jgi:hypothetical protein
MDPFRLLQTTEKVGTRSLRVGRCLKNEFYPIFDSESGNLDQLIAVRGVSRDHRLTGSHRLGEILFAFLILLKDFFPRRSNENAAVIPKSFGALST